MTSFVRASKSCAATLACAAWLAAPSGARAQTSDKALAETLFREGRDLFEKGDYPAACAKFAASQRLEAKLGTLLNLAACHEAAGRTASAWAEYTEAVTQAQRAQQPDRVDFARGHAEALEGILSRIRMLVRSPAPGLRVTLDGLPLDEAAVGTPIPVDPGKHELVADAPGFQAWRQSVVVPRGPHTDDVEVAPLVPIPPAPPASSVPTPDSPPVTATPPVEDRPSWRRPVGIAALGVGAVGVAIGSYLGLLAFSRKADGDRTCDPTGCTQVGLDDFGDATRAANASTVAFAVGVVAVAAGAYLLISSGGPAPVRATGSRSPFAWEVAW